LRLPRRIFASIQSGMRGDVRIDAGIDDLHFNA